MTVLIGGLLPDFDLMKHTLDQNKNLDLATTISDLVEYSRTQGLLAVAKGKGAAQSGSKVFNANSRVPFADANGNDKPRVPFADRPCRGWAAKNCTYGDKCKFSHAAPGGALALKKTPRSEQQPPRNPGAPGGAAFRTKDKEETSAYALRDPKAASESESRAHWHKPPPSTPVEPRSHAYIVRALPQDDQVALTTDKVIQAPTSTQDDFEKLISELDAALGINSQNSPIPGLRVDADEIVKSPSVIPPNTQSEPLSTAIHVSPTAIHVSRSDIDAYGTAVPLSCSICFGHDHVRADCTLKFSVVCDTCLEHGHTTADCPLKPPAHVEAPVPAISWTSWLFDTTVMKVSIFFMMFLAIMTQLPMLGRR
jgi:hypothetical protein